MSSAPFPPDCAERFHHRRALAEGGFGSVHLADQIGLDRQVAIKILHADSAKIMDHLARFRDEARITASILHPNVVRLFDFGAQHGVPWIAYEYVAGRSLRQLLASGPLPVGQALAIAENVARALGAAHSAGVLHRDVKPENVLVEEGGTAKLTDFGIAKWTGGGGVKTESGLVLGTPAYLSPERITGDTAGPGSDLYALGVMLYEMLVGAPPFHDDNITRLLGMHLKAPVPKASERNPRLPRAIDSLLARAMAKSPKDRPVSAEAMGDEILRLLEEVGGPRNRMTEVTTAAPTLSNQSVTEITQVPPPPRRGAAALALAAAVALLSLGALHLGEPRPLAPASPATPSGPAPPDRTKFEHLVAQADTTLRPGAEPQAARLGWQALEEASRSGIPPGTFPVPVLSLMVQSWSEEIQKIEETRKRAKANSDLLTAMAHPDYGMTAREKTRLALKRIRESAPDQHEWILSRCRAATRGFEGLVPWVQANDDLGQRTSLLLFGSILEEYCHALQARGLSRSIEGVIDGLDGGKDRWMAHYFRAHRHNQSDRPDQYLAEAQKAVAAFDAPAATPGDRIWEVRWKLWIILHLSVANALKKSGRPDDACAHLDTRIGKLPPGARIRESADLSSQVDALSKWMQEHCPEYKWREQGMLDDLGL